MPERATCSRTEREVSRGRSTAYRSRTGEHPNTGKFRAREGPNGTESESVMSLERKMPQTPVQAGRTQRGAGEARGTMRREEDLPATKDDEHAGTRALMEEVVHPDNLQSALKRVKANKGSPGADGMPVDQLSDYLCVHWQRHCEDLLAGRYQPQPVRRVEIPKASGGTRRLGIPTVVDRLIQQAILQVLQPRFDPTFSEHSYGFRPGRSTHDAIAAAQRYVAEGRGVVVDVDLEKFFDRVHHDVLMGRLAKRIVDKRLLGLIRRYLEAGILADGVVTERHEGTPQGGPLSPLLANVLLDEVDKELERRGHAFVRYADDCNVYVRSERAGERVMAFLRRKYASLHLRLNESKSAVAPVWGRKFLGYHFYRVRGEVRRGVAAKAVEAFKDRVRKITRRTAGRSLPTVIGDLNKYLRGWKAYFARTQQVKIFEALDGWIRRRLRALQIKHWRWPTTIYDGLRAIGFGSSREWKIVASPGGWWHRALRAGWSLPPDWFDRLGLMRLSA
jgi:RNA-directed DNA polymerase